MNGQYVELLVTILVFVLGIPALALQISVPERMRKVVDRYRWKIFAPPLYAAFLLCILIFLLFWPPLEPFGCILGPAIIMTGLGIAVLLWWKSTGWSIQRRLIAVLTSLSVRHFRYNEILPSDVIKDLICIGACSESPQGKSLVLGSAETIIIEVQAPKQEISLVFGSLKEIALYSLQPNTTLSSYDGAQLEELLEHFHEVFADNQNHGSAEDHLQAARILLETFKRACKQGLAMDGDADLALRALEKIGLAALDRGYLGVVMHVLGSVGEHQRVLFSIGKAAIAASRFDIAAFAYRKLEAVAFPKLNDGPSQRTAYLLGMLSLFSTAGEIGNRHAQEIIAQYQNVIQRSLKPFLRLAIEFHRLNADFVTANRLATMSSQLLP